MNTMYIYFHVMIVSTLLVFASLTGGVVENKQEKLSDNLMGTSFPILSGETLEGKKIALPSHIAQKAAVLVVAFEPGAQQFIESWHKPIFNRYAKNNEIDYYVIPMISSWYYPVSSFIGSTMKKRIPQTLHKYVTLYYGSLRGHQKKLGMNNTKLSYIFVVDKQGLIHYTSQGKAEQKDLDSCFSVIDRLKGGKG